jgi:hypothetical protein
MLAGYNQRNLSQLLFHAKNEGFDFTAEEMAEVRGKLEANVILIKDKDPYDGDSQLWREMWGRYHLEYLINHVMKRHTDEELWSLIKQRGPEVA